MNKRHIWTYKLLRPVAIAFLKTKFDFRFEKAKNLPRQYMVLSNHATDYDPLLVACSFPEHMYFMGSEHIARWGFVSKLIQYLVDPIMRCKGAPAVTAVRSMLRRIRNGHNVCFFPEGVRTWDGMTAPISRSTAKLVKTAGCGLITYKLTGGYFASPMWGGAKVRRGPVRGSIVHIYTDEEIKAMSLQQLHEAIVCDLQEDAYARQMAEPKPYRSKFGAAGLENLLFICPVCGAYDSYRRAGDQVRCACGNRIGYSAYGTLEGCEFTSAKELLDWQKTRLRLDVAEQMTYTADSGTLRTVKDHASRDLGQGMVSMSREKLCCGEFVIDMDSVTELAMHGQRHLVFTAAGVYYELTVADGGNALKFWLYFQALREKEEL